MNIATQGGKIIVKDGKLAEGCDCCGGWYCYSAGCGTCPCNYAKTLPGTLSATLSFEINAPLYGAVIGNFTGAFVSTTQLLPSQAASVNGTYTLTKSSSAFAECVYEYRAAGVAGIETFIRIHVGYGGRLGYSYQPLATGTSYYPCQQDQASLSLIFFSFGVPVSFRQDGYVNAINALCGGASYLSNAASYQHNGSSSMWFPADANDGWSCLGSPIYSLGLGYDWSPSASELPPCTQCPIDAIDHTWRVGVKYTDTSGSSPVVRTIPKAVTLRVFE